MLRKVSLLAASMLVALSCLPGHSQDSPSPSLGDLARQAQAEKDKNRASAAKVMTNDNMPSSSGHASLGLGDSGSSNSSFNVSFPDRAWAIQIAAVGFKAEADEIKPDGRKYFLATNVLNGVTISVTLERGGQNATAEECHASTSRRAQQAASAKWADVATRDVGPFAVVEYTIAEVKGVKLNQRNVFGCLAKGDVYADLHISKASFVPSDEGLLMAYLESARAVDKPADGAKRSGPTSMDLFRKGSFYYAQQDYKNAIGPYQSALDLEKSDPRLGQTFWRVLIDNLAVAYGITGDLKNSKEVITYGMSKDPTYPLFYYNMACAYAESNDIDNTMANLKRAFQYKQNVISGEAMPNPRTDDSFQRFMQSKRFLDLLDSL
jgi:tetratricopeptide (TPR) repeat protein